MTTSSLPADTLRTAVLKVLADEVKAATDDGKASLKDVMDGLGIRSLTATLADGTEVATVSRAGGAESPKVTDPDKFLAWVAENRPGEIVQSVRDSYTDALLAAMRKTGEPVDPETGEVVPGVEFRAGAEYLAVRFASGPVDGRERIKQAWRDRELDLAGLLALPGGEPDAHA